MLRARLIAGVPADVIGSLSGLTEGRFPVYAHARYADDMSVAKAAKKVGVNQNAAQLVESSAKRKGINIFAKAGSPVIAVNDGVIKKMGNSKKLGRFIVLQDVYGNQYTYSGLGELSRVYPVPKNELRPARPRPRRLRQRVRRAVDAHREAAEADRARQRRPAEAHLAPSKPASTAKSSSSSKSKKPRRSPSPRPKCASPRRPSSSA